MENMMFMIKQDKKVLKFEHAITQEEYISFMSKKDMVTLNDIDNPIVSFVCVAQSMLEVLNSKFPISSTAVSGGYTNRNGNVFLWRMNPYPSTKEERERMAFEFADAYADKIFEATTKNALKNPVYENPIAPLLVSFVGRHLPNARYFSFESSSFPLRDLYPNYLKISSTSECITAITNITKFRYGGAWHESGPYEISLLRSADNQLLSSSEWVKNLIRIKYHDYTTSKIIPEGKILVGNDPGYVHPHVSRGAPCLGDYVTPITQAFEANDLYKVLQLLWVFLNSVSNNWYHNASLYKSLPKVHHDLFFREGLGAVPPDVRASLRSPVKDYKDYGVEDAYSTINRLSQPTPDHPNPRILRPPEGHPISWSHEKGGDHYITKYHYYEFDEDGYDPEGYNDQGYNRNNLDRLGLVPGQSLPTQLTVDVPVEGTPVISTPTEDAPSWRYDDNGLDDDGYDSEGFNANGYNEDGYDRNGFDVDGYNEEGYDLGGFNREGFNADGNHRDDFDEEGNFIESGYGSDNTPIPQDDGPFFTDDDVLRGNYNPIRSEILGAYSSGATSEPPPSPVNLTSVFSGRNFSNSRSRIAQSDSEQ
jgi:hypothetical protein